MILLLLVREKTGAMKASLIAAMRGDIRPLSGRLFLVLHVKPS